MLSQKKKEAMLHDNKKFFIHTVFTKIKNICFWKIYLKYISIFIIKYFFQKEYNKTSGLFGFDIGLKDSNIFTLSMLSPCTKT